MRSTRALSTVGATALGCLLTASVTVSAAPTGSLGAGGPLGSLDVVGSLDPSEGEFDLQAHRGGVGLHVESSPQAFSHALELGVTTLELDTQVTADGEVVVTHDRRPRTDVCQDTEPVTAGDPLFPYMDTTSTN